MSIDEKRINTFYPQSYLTSNIESISLIPSLNELQIKSNQNSNFLILSELIYKNNNFQINNPILSKDLNNIILNKNQLTRTWKISPKNIETEIKVGDIIKLGRVRLKFDKIYLKNLNLQTTINQHLSNQINQQNTNNNYISNNGTYSINNITNINNSLSEIKDEKNDNNSEDSNNKFLCRICYKSDSNKKNPLISPCKCNGSMQYIHYICLKQCIDAKINKKEDENFKLFTWKNFECEICKMEYPKYLKYKNNIYPMVDIGNSFESYSICDYTLYDDAKKKTFRKGLIVFKINEDYDEIPVGRTQTNRIKLKDISVSRVHCYIIRKNNNLYVVDKGSKFGTLIYIKKSINLNLMKCNNNNFSECLISGKHCFTFSLEQNLGFFEKLFSFNIQCCKYNKQSNENDIDVENLKDNFNEQIESEQNKNFDDSYVDYVLSLETIINAKEDDDNNKTNFKEITQK